MKVKVLKAPNKEEFDEIVKYKHFPVGEKDKPRFPVFIGFRAKEDMDVS